MLSAITSLATNVKHNASVVITPKQAGGALMSTRLHNNEGLKHYPRSLLLIKSLMHGLQNVSFLRDRFYVLILASTEMIRRAHNLGTAFR